MSVVKAIKSRKALLTALEQVRLERCQSLLFRGCVGLVGFSHLQGRKARANQLLRTLEASHVRMTGPAKLAASLCSAKS